MEVDRDRGKEGIVYEERVGYGIWFKPMVVVITCLFVFILVMAVRRGTAWPIALASGLFLFLVLVFANFWYLEFRITKEHIRFGFGVLKRVFPRSDIIYCVSHQIRFKNYLGYGIRLGLDGTTAYNTRSGSGVKIAVTGKKRPYVISVDNPARICEILGREGPTGAD